MTFYLGGDMQTELIPREEVPLPSVPTARPSYAEIIVRCAQNGISAEIIEKLTAAQKEEDAQAASAAFAASMRSCQQEMPAVVKDADNRQTNSRYARLESINRVITPVYTKHGFSLSFGTGDSPLAEHMRITCDVMHSAGHTKSYHLDLPPDGSGIKGTANKTAVHAMGSTMSYGRRYLTMMIFNLALADEDNDAQRPTVEEKTITDGDCRALEQMLMQSNSDMAAFCNAYLITKVSDLIGRPVSQLEMARGQIHRKMAKIAQEAAK
jgi:hypothetical protein